MENNLVCKERFLYSSPRGCVPFDAKQLESFLPLGRPGGGEEEVSQITYRAYLEAVRQFVHDNRDQFIEVLAGQGLKDLTKIQSIDFISEKHGADYHPAKIKVRTARSSYSFAVNVALTERGKHRIRQDFELLTLFGERFPAKYIPKVYFLSKVNVMVNEKDVVMPMFIGEWLEGYHEFHLSVDPETSATGVILWDLTRGYRIVSAEAEAEIYRQAALILTYYYDVTTFAEVYPWHHAAGDFVAKLSERTVDVKLITLRQYAPRIVFPTRSLDKLLDALLVFLANLTVRTRLDRLDGVGEVAWAEDRTVDATIRGFLAGLKAKVAAGMCDKILPTQFLEAAKRMQLADLAQIFQTIAESYDEDAPDRLVILEHLVDHVFQVYRQFQELPSSV